MLFFFFEENFVSTDAYIISQVVNKWFALQALSDISGNVENVRNLLSHPAFDLCNPNKVYSLIGGFCESPVNFHAKDGSGYRFLGEIVLQLDKINPQVFSRTHHLILFANHYFCFVCFELHHIIYFINVIVCFVISTFYSHWFAGCIPDGDCLVKVEALR